MGYIIGYIVSGVAILVSVIVALVAQVVRGLFLGTQFEGYALLLEVLYLLLDREDRLPIVGFGHARSPVIDLRILFYQHVCPES